MLKLNNNLLFQRDYMAGKGLQFWQNKWEESAKKIGASVNENEKNQMLVSSLFRLYSELYFTSHGKDIGQNFIKDSNLLLCRSLLVSGRKIPEGHDELRSWEGKEHNKIVKRRTEEWETYKNNLYAPVGDMLQRICDRIFKNKVIDEDGDVHQILQTICEKTNLRLDDFGFNIRPAISWVDYLCSCFGFFNTHKENASLLKSKKNDPPKPH